MIIVADSGSTKCDWILIDRDRKLRAETMGFNPFFHSADFIFEKIAENEVLNSSKERVEEVHFYGAGCSNVGRINIVKEALAKHFINAKIITVEEDLNGAAYATCGNDEGIVCILGTGSNACYYDGQNVIKGQPALGYILGDEGSGAYFGKVLVSSYLYGNLPKELALDLEEYCNPSLDSVLSSVYNEPHANVYLASFMKFISNHKSHEFFENMIYDGMKRFAEIHITHHPNYKNIPVSFVGSIAFYFEDVLKRVAEDMEFNIGNIIQKPIDALTDFHLAMVNSELEGQKYT
ncbi:N-acetylglucosamine kinase [bacterium]|nr:N-acetylglucosamine kinase [bacterium]